MLSKQVLINNIERDDVWDSAKHLYASTLLKEYDSISVREFLFNKFKNTGDYYYCSILKEDVDGEKRN